MICPSSPGVNAARKFEAKLWNWLGTKNPYRIAYPACPKTENKTDEVDGVNMRTAVEAKDDAVSFDLPAAWVYLRRELNVREKC